ncbi:MAG TPA: solute:sodium symporter family transporter [Puia sp.]
MPMNIAISFLCCTAVVAVISWYKTRKQRVRTATDHFMGSRSLGFWIVGGSLFLTNISANQFIGENESVYLNNMTVMAWGMSSIVAMLIVSEFFMPIYLKIGALTTADFLEERFDASTKKIITFIFLAGYLVNLIPAVLYGGAVAFEGIFHVHELLGISHWAAIWLFVTAIAVIGCLYSLLGGLKAITISDSVQGLGMIAGGLLLPYYGFKYLGHGSVTAGIHTVLHSHTEHLNAIGSAKDSVPFGTIFTGMLLVNLYYWGMEQFIIQQALAAKSLEQGQKGIALACVGKLVSPLLLNIPGLIAVHLYVHMENTAAVFPRLVGDVMPPLWAGFIAAIVFGAALSTFNAGLNSSATLFIMNLYAPWKRAKDEKTNERHLLRTSKWFQIIITLMGIGIAPFIMFFKGGFYTYIQKASSFFSIPVFTILIVGFVTKKVPPVAAKIGLCFFVVVYALTQFVFNTELHYLHVLFILFVGTALLMLLIGKIKPMAVPYRPRQMAVVNVEPWKNRHWYSVVLILLVIVLFALFSPTALVK